MKSFTMLAVSLGASLASAAPGAQPDKTYPGPGCPAPTRTSTVTAKPPHTTTSAVLECFITNTHTWYGNKAGGCQFDPAGDNCVVDAILTLPCECGTAASVADTTTTVCATTANAVNCHTGYMYTTTASNC